MTDDRPLVTFALIAYKQEKYIREAVEGALSQTYAPLEIILSDDSSSDRTFDIMRELASNYQGAHTIYCNRNVHNLGLASHVNLVNEKAQGELIVVAAGDDISVPERVATIVDAYLKSRRQSHYFYSVVRKINESGELLELAQSPGGINAHSRLLTGLSNYPLAIGAGQAWTKKLTTSFPPMGRYVYAEDQIYGYRGILLGPVTPLDQPLVNYRIGSGISTTVSSFTIRKYINGRWNILGIYLQRARDSRHRGARMATVAIYAKLFLLVVLLPVAPLISFIRRVRRIIFQ
jgi:glycosyltransferase involved in cell wall biosynthesis